MAHASADGLASAQAGTRLRGHAGSGERGEVIGYHEAVARLLEGAGRCGEERVALGRAAGRILAGDIVSAMALPAFDNAAMDGVALVGDGPAARAGSCWEVASRIAAGDVPPQDDAHAWHVMTGAALPTRAATVVPLEGIERLPDARVRLRDDASPGAHIRRRGDDVREGDALLASGTMLHAAQLMLLAGVGQNEVAVARRPRVAVLATGGEIVAAGTPLPPGGIHDATSPYLRASLVAAGGEPVFVRRVGDEVPVFQAAVDAALAEGADLVLSTGAVSKGCYDFVPSALQARGAETLFHGVALRPGKPVLAARLREGAMFLGLPGNPLSTAVGFRFLVEPLLRAWLGLPPETPCWLPLADDCRSRAGLHAVLHGALRCDGHGRLRAHVAQAQASFRLLPFSQAMAWITLPSDLGDVGAGTPVQVHGLSHLQPPAWMPA